MILKINYQRIIVLLYLILTINITYANSVLDRNYTLADAGIHFLESVSTIPDFIVLISIFIGVFMVVQAAALLLKIGQQNQQVKKSSVFARLIFGALITSISLYIGLFGTTIFPSSTSSHEWFKNTAAQSTKPASRTSIEKCLKGNKCEQY